MVGKANGKSGKGSVIAMKTDFKSKPRLETLPEND